MRVATLTGDRSLPPRSARAHHRLTNVPSFLTLVARATRFLTCPSWVVHLLKHVVQLGAAVKTYECCAIKYHSVHFITHQSFAFY